MHVEADTRICISRMLSKWIFQMFDTNYLYLCCFAGSICIIPSSITRTVDSVWYWKKNQILAYTRNSKIFRTHQIFSPTDIPCFTGCDAVSAFAFIGNKTAYKCMECV